MPKTRCACDGTRAFARSAWRPPDAPHCHRGTQEGFTPLHLASAAGHREVTGLLVDKSDVDAEDGSGNTPVWAALRAGQSTLARFLIQDAGADVNAACEQGKTYLHLAAERKAADDVSWLLAHGAAHTAKDMHSNTPLHAAAGAGAWDVGRVLLDAGANANARGKVRSTCISACSGPHAWQHPCRTRARRCMWLLATHQARLGAPVSLSYFWTETLTAVHSTRCLRNCCKPPSHPNEVTHEAHARRSVRPRHNWLEAFEPA